MMINERAEMQEDGGEESDVQLHMRGVRIARHFVARRSIDHIVYGGEICSGTLLQNLMDRATWPYLIAHEMYDDEWLQFIIVKATCF